MELFYQICHILLHQAYGASVFKGNATYIWTLFKKCSKVATVIFKLVDVSQYFKNKKKQKQKPSTTVYSLTAAKSPVLLFLVRQEKVDRVG